MNRTTSNTRPILMIVVLASMIATGLLISQPGSAKGVRSVLENRNAAQNHGTASETRPETASRRFNHSPNPPSDELATTAIPDNITHPRRQSPKSRQPARDRSAQERKSDDLWLNRYIFSEKLHEIERNLGVDDHQGSGDPWIFDLN